jgi:hypothetical protein
MNSQLFLISADKKRMQRLQSVPAAAAHVGLQVVHTLQPDQNA